MKTPVTCHIPIPSLGPATSLDSTCSQGRVPLSHPPGILLASWHLSLLTRTLQCLSFLYSPSLPSSQPFLSGVPHSNHSTQGQILKFSPRTINKQYYFRCIVVMLMHQIQQISQGTEAYFCSSGKERLGLVEAFSSLEVEKLQFSQSLHLHHQ